MIDLNSLYVLWLAHRLGGVTAAARKLKITQPAVSQRLRVLERKLGGKLYDRVENRFAVVGKGLEIVGFCGPAFELLEELPIFGLPSRRSAPRQAGSRIDAVVLGKRAVLFPTNKPARMS